MRENAKKLLARLPSNWGVFYLVVLFLSIYCVLFAIPRTIAFSYADAESTCIDRFVLAPRLRVVVAPDGFEAQYQGEVTLGGVPIASSRLCFTPKAKPQPGQHAVAVASLSLVGVTAHRYIITVPSEPKVRALSTVDESISVKKPLEISLSSVDRVNRYEVTLSNSNKAATLPQPSQCAYSDTKLVCDVAKLGLLQGSAYKVSLYRSYEKTAKTLVHTWNVKTLSPLTVTSRPFENNKIFYDSPTQFHYTFDSAVKEAKVSLVKKDKDKETSVPVTQLVKDKDLTVSFGALDRRASYALRIDSAMTQEGRSIESPDELTFSTSGGPKVVSVSAPTSGVARNQAIVVTFDQPVSVDAGKTYGRIQGANATIRKTADNQVTFSLQAGDCAPFTLFVEEVKGELNNIAIEQAWRYSSKTVCGYSWTIGYSVQGRPITAYSIGSGSKVVLFTGGMHGSEQSGYSTMLAWANYLQQNDGVIPAGVRVIVVPNTNPDGIAANSRNNSRNVNIDRNFPTSDWKSSIETSSGVLPTGGGVSAASEPETAALMALTRQFRPRLEVSFHSQGRLVGANKYSDSVAIGNVYASIVGYKTMFNDAEAVMGYSMTGEYEDWMGQEMNIPAILIELPASSGNYLSSQLTALKRMLAV